MTSKEMSHLSRPLNTSGGLAVGRPSHSRNHSHTIVGLYNGTHRINRRKSGTSSGANVAAVAAALQEVGDRAPPLPIAIQGRRSTVQKNGIGVVRSVGAGSTPSPASMPTHKFVTAKRDTHMQDGSAIDDDPNDMSGEEGDASSDKARVRRASDGQPLVKEGRKSSRPELRCDKCGKGYKHGSCLVKHLWEHTPEWSYTSKLLISKHQQVQLLEAASVLVAMNTKASSDSHANTIETIHDYGSDPDSASPAASGYSDIMQDRSSAGTTPPPSDTGNAHEGYLSFAKLRNNGDGFGHSNHKAPFNNSAACSMASVLGQCRQLSHDHRPSSSEKNTTDQEDHELANAVELLSCSISSNGISQSRHMLNGVPRVPQLPVHYLDQTSFFGSYASRAPESYTRGETRRDGVSREDVKMEDSTESDDEDLHSRARSEEEDDGVFGKMET